MLDAKLKRQIKLSAFFVLCVCFSSFIVFLNERHENKNSETLTHKALKRIDIHAKRLIKTKFIDENQKERKTPPIKIVRGLASIDYKKEKLDGLVGLDPWGHPFQYFVKREKNNTNKGVLIIWSKGPDSKLNTTKTEVSKNHSHFKGDDFGKVISFSL